MVVKKKKNWYIYIYIFVIYWRGIFYFRFLLISSGFKFANLSFPGWCADMIHGKKKK